MFKTRRQKKGQGEGREGKKNPSCAGRSTLVEEEEGLKIPVKTINLPKPSRVEGMTTKP